MRGGTVLDVAHARARRGECPLCASTQTRRRTKGRVHEPGNPYADRPILRVEDETRTGVFQCDECGAKWEMLPPPKGARANGIESRTRPVEIGGEVMDVQQVGFLVPRGDHALLLRIASSENKTMSQWFREQIARAAREKGFRK